MGSTSAPRRSRLASPLRRGPDARGDFMKRRVVFAGLLAAPAVSLFAIVALLLLLAGAAQQRCGDDGALAGDFSGPGALGGVAGTGLTAAQVRAVRQGSP